MEVACLRSDWRRPILQDADQPDVRPLHRMHRRYSAGVVAYEGFNVRVQRRLQRQLGLPGHDRQKRPLRATRMRGLHGMRKRQLHKQLCLHNAETSRQRPRRMRVLLRLRHLRVLPVNTLHLLRPKVPWRRHTGRRKPGRLHVDSTPLLRRPRVMRGPLHNKRRMLLRDGS